MAGPAAICIEAVRQRPLEIAGLKVFSSLQGPAGERRTIYREACVAVIAIAIDIGTMTTGTPGATQSLRPTAPRIVDVAAIGKKTAAIAAIDTRRDCLTPCRPSAAPCLDVAVCSRELLIVAQHRRNGCPPTAQTSGLARSYRRGKLMTARSTLTHRTEEAPHRRRKNSKSGAVTDKIFEKKRKKKL